MCVYTVYIIITIHLNRYECFQTHTIHKKQRAKARFLFVGTLAHQNSKHQRRTETWKSFNIKINFG